MKRLVVFAPGYSDIGGAARRSRLLAETLAARGWDLLVIARAGTATRFAFRRDAPLRVIEIPGWDVGRWSAIVYYLLALPLGLMLGRKASAILGIQLASPAMVAGICGKLLRIPYVLFSTTSGELGEASYLRTAFPSSLRIWLLRGAHRVVSQTTASAAGLSDIAGPEKVMILPNPVSQEPLRPLTHTQRVLYAGRFSEEKGLLELLAAWSLVMKRLPNAVLTLAGVGGSYRSVEGEIRAAIADDETLRSTVRLPGWIDVSKALTSHDVFVLPSRSEGMSNALLEACAAGRVVVASDIESNVAVLGSDYPLLFRVGDVDALAECLGRAMTEQDLRSNCASRNRDRMRIHSPDAVAERLEELISLASYSPRH